MILISVQNGHVPKMYLINERDNRLGKLDARVIRINDSEIKFCNYFSVLRAIKPCHLFIIHKLFAFLLDKSL